MNRERRARLRQAAELLTSGTEMLEDVLAEEEGALDNMPENLQGSERFATMEEGIDMLSQAVDDMIEIAEKILEL